jgi:hypothetical protein
MATSGLRGWPRGSSSSSLTSRAAGFAVASWSCALGAAGERSQLLQTRTGLHPAGLAFVDRGAQRGAGVLIESPAVSPIRRRKVTTWRWTVLCRFCGHKWTSLGPKPPKRCASCKKLNPAKKPARRK